jgi:hypothetical protein
LNAAKQCSFTPFNVRFFCRIRLASLRCLGFSEIP